MTLYNMYSYVLYRLRNFIQEFWVKYAHKYAQKSTKICKNVLKYALNMKKNIFTKMSSFLIILRVLVSFTTWVHTVLLYVPKLGTRYTKTSCFVYRVFRYIHDNLWLQFSIVVQQNFINFSHNFAKFSQNFFRFSLKYISNFLKFLETFLKKIAKL